MHRLEPMARIFSGVDLIIRGIRRIRKIRVSPFDVQHPATQYTKDGIMTKRIQLSSPAPDFDLSDFNGNFRSLAEFRGQKNVVLVFNRGFV
jgi:hypothetical protein